MNWKLTIPIAVVIAAVAAFWALNRDPAQPGQDPSRAGGTRAASSFDPEAGDPTNEETSTKTAESAKTEEEAPVVPTGPLLLRGEVYGEGRPIPSANVLFFAVRHIESLIQRLQLLAPTAGALPNIPKIVDSLKAELNAFKRTAIRCTTDLDGKFELRDAPEGGYIMLTYAPGWLFEYGDVVSVTYDRDSFIRVDLDRGASIQGRVVGDSSQPVSGVKVIAEYRPPGAPPLGRLVRRGLRFLNGEFLKGPFERTTDSQGAFEIDGLPPGRYDLTAYDENGLETTVENIETGSDSTVIYFGQGGSVEGVLVDNFQVPVPGIRVSLERVEEMIQLPPIAANFSQLANVINGYLKERPIEVTSKEDGTFVFSPLSEGAYRLFIDAPGFFPVSRQVNVNWGNQTILGLVEMNRGLSIVGVVRDVNGQPLEGATILANSTEVNFMSMGSTMKDFLTQRLTTESRADGSFVLSGLKGGTYRVVASYEHYAPDVRGPVQAGEAELVFDLVPGITLSGRVIARETGEPLREATVRISENVTLTDENGEFQLHGVVAGGRPAGELAFGGGRFRRGADEAEPSVRLSVQAKGYRSTRETVMIDPAPGALEFALEAAPIITGTVYDPKGEPAAGALVRLCPDFPDEFKQLGFMDTSLIFLAVTVSDLEGKFTIEEYQAFPGRYAILADHLQYARGVSEGFSFREAAEGGAPIEVRVDLVESATVKGVVTDGQYPVVGAEVRLAQQTPDLDMQGRMVMNMIGLPKGGDVTHTDAEGRYEFTKVLPGDYEISSEMVGYSETPAIPFQLAVGQTVEFPITLKPGGTLAGQVVDIGGLPIPNARVRLLRSSEDDGVMEAQRFLGGSYKTTATDAEGAYELTGIAEGIYTVVADCEGYSPVEVDHVVPGQAMPVIRLTPAAGLRGFVVDQLSGQPIANYKVRVQPASDQDPDWMGRFTKSIQDRDGMFEENSLEAGEYRVEIQAAGYLNAESTVRLEPGIALTTDIALVRAGVVRGRVTSDYGEPVEGVRVWFEVQQEKPEDETDEQRIRSQFRRRMGNNSVSTDIDGYYFLDTLPDGKVELHFQHDDFRPIIRRDVQVALGEELILDAELDRGISVSGVLLDERGQPLADQWFVLMGEGDAQGMQKWSNADDRGRFEFSGLAPGKYRVVAPGRKAADEESAKIELEEGRDRTNLRISLVPEAEGEDQ